MLASFSDLYSELDLISINTSGSIFFSFYFLILNLELEVSIMSYITIIYQVINC